MKYNKPILTKISRAGFTLIEMLTVVLIVGILTAVVLPQYRRAVQKAESTEAVAMLRAIRDSGERLAAEFGYRTIGAMASSSDSGKVAFKRMDMFDNTTIKCSFASTGTTMTCDHFQYDLNAGSAYITATKLNSPYNGTKFCLSWSEPPQLLCNDGSGEDHTACDLYNITYNSGC